MPLDTQNPAREISLAKIPAFPAVVLRVLDILSQDEVDFDLVVREIASDATLAAQVLRLANSPLFGFAAQIATVQHAVVALGTSQVQSLVMSVATASYSRAALQTEALRRVWRHTLASAVLCREVARAAGTTPEKAYSLGLLHDIGRLGLLVAWPDDYNLILREADRDGLSLLDLERRLFSKDHCEVGRLLVEQWKLPPEFRLITGRHHDPPSGLPQVDELRIAYLGCQMADSLGYWVSKPLEPPSIEQLLAELPQDVRERFPADPQKLRELVELSVNGGDDALAEARPDVASSVRETFGFPLSARAPVGNEDALDAEANSLAGDYAIVLVSVLTFMAVMIVYHFWSQQ